MTNEEYLYALKTLYMPPSPSARREGYGSTKFHTICAAPVRRRRRTILGVPPGNADPPLQMRSAGKCDLTNATS
jgi:hypothetical protein